MLHKYLYVGPKITSGLPAVIIRPRFGQTRIEVIDYGCFFRDKSNTRKATFIYTYKYSILQKKKKKTKRGRFIYRYTIIILLLIPIEWSLVIKRNQSHQRELEPCTILLYRCFFFLRSRDFPHILHVYYVCYYTCIVRVLTITRQDPFSSHNILGTI